MMRPLISLLSTLVVSISFSTHAASSIESLSAGDEVSLERMKLGAADVFLLQHGTAEIEASSPIGSFVQDNKTLTLTLPANIAESGKYQLMVQYGSGEQELLETVFIRANSKPVSFILIDNAASTFHVGQPISFNAGASYDVDGELSAYSWSTASGEFATQSRAQKVFDKPGEYQVTLTVTDNSGLASSYTKLIEVTPAENQANPEKVAYHVQ